MKSMSKMIEFLPDGLGRVGKRSYSFMRIEMPRGGLNFSQTKNIFYLQDFYDLLNEEGEITRWQRGGPIEPQITTYRKIYTMGPLCGALLYNENGEEKFMFYDGNFSNVAGIDIFGNDLYSNEYGPNGEILYSIDYSNISFACTLFDEDTNSYIDQSSGAISPFRNLSYSVYATPIIKMMRGFGGNLHSTISAPHSVSWEWIMWMFGDSRTGQDFIDCALEVICGLDFDCENGGEGGDGEGGDKDDECKNPKSSTLCNEVCKNLNSCESCCQKVYNKCVKDCKDNKECIQTCSVERNACLGICASDFPN